MSAFSALLSESVILFGAVSVINSLLIATGCALACAAVFKLSVRKNTALFIAAALLAVGSGLMQTAAARLTDNNVFGLAASGAEFLCPFFCMLLIFPKRSAWKAALITVGATFAEALKYLILMAYTSFDIKNEDASLDLAAESIISFILFVLILGFFLLYARKRHAELAIAKINIPLYVMIVLTTMMFIATMLEFGLSATGENRIPFLFALADIPLFAVTVIYAVRTTLRSRLAEENYRQIMEMQVRHYEQMERKNEELKVFRHDFPKKLRPLRLYLSEGRNDEAEKILEEFSVTVESARPRYSTGNFRLDTVLECQQQIAEKDGINIVVPFDSVFPAEGIAPEDIYTIFPNALDNAIDAARACGGGEITVASMLRGNTLFVRISNPFTGKLNIKNGGIETTKTDAEHHGYGLKSIKKAAAKYGSDNVSFTCENGKFTLDMILELNSSFTV